MTADMLRPKEAAKKFGIARTTLNEWADKKWVGRSRIGGVTLLNATDIADLIAANTVPRQVVPITESTETSAADDQWRDDEMWQGTVAARGVWR